MRQGFALLDGTASCRTCGWHIAVGEPQCR